MSEHIPPFNIFEWQKSIRNSETLSYSARLTAFLLATYADSKGVCWPSTAKLAASASLCRKTISKAIQELRDENLIQIRQQIGRSNVYKLSTTCVPGTQGCVPDTQGCVPDTQGVCTRVTHEQPNNYPYNKPRTKGRDKYHSESQNRQQRETFEQKCERLSRETGMPPRPGESWRDFYKRLTSVKH